MAMNLDNLPSRTFLSLRRRLRILWRFTKSSPLNAFALLLVFGVLYTTALFDKSGIATIGIFCTRNARVA